MDNGTTKDFYDVFDSITRLYNYHIINHNTFQLLDSYTKRFDESPKALHLPEAMNLRNEFKNSVYDIFQNELNINEGFGYFIAPNYMGYHISAISVKSIKYSSPGSIDLLGFGKIFDSLKETVFYYWPNSEKKKDIKLKEFDIQMKEQELISKKIENLKSLGFSTTEIQSFIGHEYYHIDRLKALKDNHKIINITIINPPEN